MLRNTTERSQDYQLRKKLSSYAGQVSALVRRNSGVDFSAWSEEDKRHREKIKAEQAKICEMLKSIDKVSRDFNTER